MKTALLSPGEKIHLMHRRRFEKDVRRHFVGQLVTPGPDLLAEGRDHMVRAVMDKAMAELEQKITFRWFQRSQRIKSNLQSPSTLRAKRS